MKRIFTLLVMILTLAALAATLPALQFLATL
jgi:hypothetical protein